MRITHNKALGVHVASANAPNISGETLSAGDYYPQLRLVRTDTPQLPENLHKRYPHKHMVGPFAVWLSSKSSVIRFKDTGAWTCSDGLVWLRTPSELHTNRDNCTIEENLEKKIMGGLLILPLTQQFPLHAHIKRLGEHMAQTGSHSFSASPNDDLQSLHAKLDRNDADGRRIGACISYREQRRGLVEVSIAASGLYSVMRTPREVLDPTIQLMP